MKNWSCCKEFLGKWEKINFLKVFRAELIIIDQRKLKGSPLSNWLQIWHLPLQDSGFPISFTSSYSWILHYDTFLSCYGMDTPKSDTTYSFHILGPLSRDWASLVAQLVKNPPAVQKTWVPSLGWEAPLEKGKATYFGLENFMDCIVHGVAKSLTGLSDFHSLELSRTGFLFFSPSCIPSGSMVRAAPEAEGLMGEMAGSILCPQENASVLLESNLFLGWLPAKPLGKASWRRKHLSIESGFKDYRTRSAINRRMVLEWGEGKGKRCKWKNVCMFKESLLKLSSKQDRK